MKRLIMNSRKARLFIALCLAIVTGTGCSQRTLLVRPSESVNYSIEGKWFLVQNESERKVIFDFIKDQSGEYRLKVWGEEAELLDYRKSMDQIIFTYRPVQGDGHHVLVTFIDHERLKFSRTDRNIRDFQPLGKLGEEIVYLEKAATPSEYSISTPEPRLTKSSRSGQH